MSWYVYMLRCVDDSLYTGVTTCVTRRVREHNQAGSAAAYTRTRRPVTLVYQEPCRSRSAALRREAEIKRFRRADKLRLIAGKY